MASGAYDIAMAIGVEKLKDSGYSGLPGLAAPGNGTHNLGGAPGECVSFVSVAGSGRS